MVKKKLNIVGIILLIAIALISINYFGGLNLFTITTIVRDSGNTDISPWYCPSDATYCKIKGKIFCEVQGDSVAKVIARVDDFDFDSGWIAYINDFGNLQSFRFEEQVVMDDPPGVRDNIVSQEILKDFYVDKDNSVIYVNIPSASSITVKKCGRCRTTEQGQCDSGWIRVGIPYKEKCWVLGSQSRQNCQDCRQPNYNKYVAGGNADLTPTPLRDCKSGEVCEGEASKYSCSGDLKIEDIPKELLTCSSNNPCSDTSSYYDINPNDKVSINSNSIDIQYQVIDEIDTCVQGDKICKNDNIYICSDNDYIIDEICDYGCDDSKCELPVENIEITLRDNQGNIKTGFISEEPINIYINVISPSVSNVNVKILKDNQEGELIEENQNSVISGQTKKFEFSGIRFTGTYYIILEIDIGLTDKIIYGKELGQYESFMVSNDFDANFIAPFQTIKGETNRENIYINYPIEIHLIAKSGDSDVFLDQDPVFTASIGNNQINLPSPTVSKGLYKYVFTPQVYGDLRIVGEVFYGGISKTVSVETKILPEDISVSWRIIADKVYDLYGNLENPPSMQIGQSYDFKFETRNRGKELMDSVNTIIVNENGVERDISSSIQPTGLGTYEFTYIPSARGGYDFIVTSSLEGFVNSQRTNTGIVQATPEPPQPDCKVDSDCGLLKTCDEGDCILSIDLILVIFGALIVLAIVLVIIFSLIKRERQPSFGGL